jgi:hypothetical protein
MAQATIVEPPWFRDLPRQAKPFQRLPTPALSFPGSTAGDNTRSLALAFRRRCSECGCAMPPGPVYRVFFSEPWAVQEDREHPGGVFTRPAPGAMHRSCAFFSAQICPFLRYSTARRRGVDYKATRGTAEIAGFNQWGLAFFTEETVWGGLWLFGYFDVAERIPYRTPKDLARGPRRRREGDRHQLAPVLDRAR